MSDFQCFGIMIEIALLNVQILYMGLKIIAAIESKTPPNKK